MLTNILRKRRICVKLNLAKDRLKHSFIVFALIIIALLVVIPLITVNMLTGAYDDQIRVDTRHTSASIQQTVRSFMDGVYNLCYELAEKSQHRYNGRRAPTAGSCRRRVAK